MSVDQTTVAGVARANSLDRLEIAVHCPVDGRHVGSVPDWGQAEIAEISAELRAAQSAWESLGPRGRSAHLLRWLDWLLDNERRVLTLVQAETGKSWAD